MVLRSQVVYSKQPKLGLTHILFINEIGIRNSLLLSLLLLIVYYDLYVYILCMYSILFWIITQ